MGDWGPRSAVTPPPPLFPKPFLRCACKAWYCRLTSRDSKKACESPCTTAAGAMSLKSRRPLAAVLEPGYLDAVGWELVSPALPVDVGSGEGGRSRGDPGSSPPTSSSDDSGSTALAFPFPFRSAFALEACFFFFFAPPPACLANAAFRCASVSSGCSGKTYGSTGLWVAPARG